MYFTQFEAVDINGNPPSKPRHSHPYSYSPYVTYRNGPNELCNSVVYSDRLYQWDWKKYNRFCEKHFGNTGQDFSQRNPSKIEAFLRDYMGNQDLNLIVIQQMCNVSNGYPLWSFHCQVNNEET